MIIRIKEAGGPHLKLQQGMVSYSNTVKEGLSP